MNINPQLRQRARSFRTQRSLGQNFLICEEDLQRIAGAISVKPPALVLEIGAGLGFLTEKLLGKGHSVTALDIDRRALAMIRPHAQLQTTASDILKYDFQALQKPFVVAGNLPFQIGTKILLNFLGDFRQAHWAVPEAQELVLMFQWEVAQRLLAKPRSKAYNSLSLLAQAKAQLELICRVPAAHFWPIPQVDAGVVRLKPHPDSPLEALSNTEQIHLEQIIRLAFQGRRKILKNALAPLLKSHSSSSSIELSTYLAQRAEELTLTDYIHIAQSLSAG